MTSMARVEEEHHGATSVARLDGEVDSSNVDDVGVRLRTLLTNRSLALVIDLSGTTYLDSAGINLIFALGEELRAHQQALRLVVDPATPIARMVALTSLDRVFATYPTRDDALAPA